MAEKVEELMQVLRKLRDLLAAHGRDQWVYGVATSLKEIEQDDAHGVSRFLGLFGGMGSISDVLFHQLNGDVGTADDLRRDNDLLSRLRSRGYELAHDRRSERNRR
jgi:hypothetical protein